jgi:uncharacterized protein (DUF58 family)
MEAGRSTQGIWLMAALLGAAAVVFEIPAFYLAAFSLVLLSALLALRFRLQMREVVTSAGVTRSVSRKMLRQGSPTAVTTEFSSNPVPGTVVRVRDILSPGAGTDPEDPAVIAGAGGSATLRYTLIPLVPGSIRFPGVRLEVSDEFFAGSIAMRSGRFAGPELDVYPHAIFERAGDVKEFGDLEKDRISIYRGYGVRSIREYVQGDDLRTIDWKMTAKHDRMFIREYTAVENFPPLLVVDLPDRSFPVPEEDLARLVSSVTGEAVTAHRDHGSVSLLLISGVNIIDIVLDEQDLTRIMTLIRTAAHPVLRLHHAYRWKNRATLRNTLRQWAAPEPGSGGVKFAATIARVCQRSLASPDTPVFATRIGRVLGSLTTKDILLYSFFDGDLSHIRELAHLARGQQIRLTPRTITGEDGGKLSVARQALGADTLQVIA